MSTDEVARQNPVLTGQYFVSGDWACAEGAIAAGCRFFAGYPITPATEIAERLALRLPQVGGTYMQFEDEIASITAIIGASYSGTKVLKMSTRLNRKGSAYPIVENLEACTGCMICEQMCPDFAIWIVSD